MGVFCLQNLYAYMGFCVINVDFISLISWLLKLTVFLNSLGVMLVILLKTRKKYCELLKDKLSESCVKLRSPCLMSRLICLNSKKGKV